VGVNSVLVFVDIMITESTECFRAGFPNALKNPKG
jgi:hypothetical protein